MRIWDTPESLVTGGPYARLRHPFYLAYLLMFLAAALIAPGAGTIGALAYAAVVLNHTAAREERLLCASDLGDQYRAYAARTGRFLPGFARQRPGNPAAFGFHARRGTVIAKTDTRAGDIR